MDMSHLKPDDVVVVVTHSHSRHGAEGYTSTVSRVTKTQVVLPGRYGGPERRFRKADGKELGTFGAFDPRPQLYDADTPEAKEAVNNSLRYHLHNRLRGYTSTLHEAVRLSSEVTDENLDRLQALLNQTQEALNDFREFHDTTKAGK